MITTEARAETGRLRWAELAEIGISVNPSLPFQRGAAVLAEVTGLSGWADLPRPASAPPPSAANLPRAVAPLAGEFRGLPRPAAAEPEDQP
jgi:hypothetical protein